MLLDIKVFVLQNYQKSKSKSQLIYKRCFLEICFRIGDTFFNDSQFDSWKLIYVQFILPFYYK